MKKEGNKSRFSKSIITAKSKPVQKSSKGWGSINKGSSNIFQKNKNGGDVLSKSSNVVNKKYLLKGSLPLTHQENTSDNKSSSNVNQQEEIKTEEPQQNTKLWFEQLEKERINNEKEIADLTNELSILDKEEIKSIYEVKDWKQKVNKIQTSINEYNDIIGMKEKSIWDIKKRNTELQKQITKLKDEVRRVGEEEAIPHNNNHNIVDDNHSTQIITVSDWLNRLMVLRGMESMIEEDHDQGMSEIEIQELPSINCTRRIIEDNHNPTCRWCDFEFCVHDGIIIWDKCDHMFHKACISNYLLRKSKCPICKESVK